MKKHAFLIIAHSNEENLINLIKSIDFEYNDIYIHIDKKWKTFNFEKIKESAMRSSITFSEKRLSITWGGDSQIFTELLLFELALQKGEYQYLHLLSGQDICIKTPLELHNFFDSHDGQEFLSFSLGDWQKDAQDRIKYYHLNRGRNLFKAGLNRIFVKTQKLLHINRLKHSNMTVCGGSNWVSITNNFAKYLVSNKKQIAKDFSHTYCADELYKHMYAFNSEFKNNLFLLNSFDNKCDTRPNISTANMRYIDWVRGNPYLFTEDDFEDIISSPYMFVRKVSSSNKLPDMILNHCINSDPIE